MRILCALALAFLLTGCMEGPPDARPAQMTFDNMRPLEINAASIEIQNKYVPPMRDPNVEHTFQPTPYAAAEAMLRKQLVAAGNENTLRVIIDDASVTRTALDSGNKVISTFVPQPEQKLKGKIALRFELVSQNAPDILLGHADVIATRERTLMTGASPAERDRTTFSLTEDLMNAANDGLQTIVKNTFGMR